MQDKFPITSICCSVDFKAILSQHSNHIKFLCFQSKKKEREALLPLRNLSRSYIESMLFRISGPNICQMTGSVPGIIHTD